MSISCIAVLRFVEVLGGGLSKEMNSPGRRTPAPDRLGGHLLAFQPTASHPLELLWILIL